MTIEYKLSCNSKTLYDILVGGICAKLGRSICSHFSYDLEIVNGTHVQEVSISLDNAQVSCPVFINYSTMFIYYDSVKVYTTAISEGSYYHKYDVRNDLDNITISDIIDTLIYYKLIKLKCKLKKK